MLKEEALTYRIRGAVFEVSRQLGPCFLESIYQKALFIELQSAGLYVEAEKPVNIYYKQCLVGEHRLDLLVEGKIMVLRHFTWIWPDRIGGPPGCQSGRSWR